MFLCLTSHHVDDVGDPQTVPLPFIGRAVHISGSGLIEDEGESTARAGGAAGPMATPGQQDELTSMATFVSGSTPWLHVNGGDVLSKGETIGLGME